MPISPKRYPEHASELEKLAQTIADPAIKDGYLQLAAELRRLAKTPPPMADQTDKQIEQFVERMVASSPSKL